MIHIGLDFIRAYSPSEQLVMLYLLLHADENGNVDFCERNISRVTEVSYKTCRTIHQRFKSEGVIKGAPTGAVEGAVGEAVTICDFDSYNVLTKIRAHIGGAPKGALKEVEITKEKENVFPQTPFQEEIENNKDEDNIKEEESNDSKKKEEELLTRLSELEKSFAELSEENRTLQEENEKLSKKKERSPVFVKPTFEEVATYVLEKGYHFDAERFHSYYESNGWMVGKNKMKDWKAACKTWENKIKKESPSLFDVQSQEKDPTIPNMDKYEPDLPYDKTMGAFLVPNKYPDLNEDWPYTPESRPDGARICNGSNGWRWDAQNKRWIEMLWIMDKRQWFDR